jgi:branched-subunit amino acid transport protein
MEGALKLWAIILLVGALNYASRLSFIALFSRRSIPPLLARALRFVPAAMLTALIVPMVVAPGGAIEPASPRVLAALVAAAVAFRTRSTLATLAAGMLALWIIQAIGS